jgi:hypothetical protein
MPVTVGIRLGNSCEFTRHQNMEVDIPRSTTQEDVKVDLNLQTHWPVSIQYINEID